MFWGTFALTVQMMEFHEVLDFVGLPRFPTTSWTGMKSGKAIIRYYTKVILVLADLARVFGKCIINMAYIYILLSFTNPCSENAEEQTTKGLRGICKFPWFTVKRGK